MRMTRVLLLATIATLGLLLTLPAASRAASDLSLAGLADALPAGPGGSLTLPLAPGSAAVTLIVSLGVPALPIPVEITAATVVESPLPVPVTVVDGDRVKVEVAQVQGVLRASKIEVENFPDIKLVGTVKGLPASGVTLPLPAGSTVDFIVSLGVSSADVPVRVTSTTRIEAGPLTLGNGTLVEVEAVMYDFALLATALSLEDGDGAAGDNGGGNDDGTPDQGGGNNDDTRPDDKGGQG
jgi:hypothetical protein